MFLFFNGYTTTIYKNYVENKDIKGPRAAGKNIEAGEQEPVGDRAGVVQEGKKEANKGEETSK